MEKQDYQKKLAAIADELLYQIKECNDYFDAMNALNAAITLHNETIHIAADFFSVVQFSLIDSIMVGLIKLYDKNKDSISIPKCLEKIKLLKTELIVSQSEWKSTFEALQKYEDKLGSYDKTLKYLRIRRDKYYMHNDNGFFLSGRSLRTLAPFNFADTSELLSIAKNICGIIYRVCSGKDWKPYIRQETMYEHVRDFSGLEKLIDAAEAEKQ